MELKKKPVHCRRQLYFRRQVRQNLPAAEIILKEQIARLY